MIPLYRQAQDWIRPALEDTDGLAIDATCGNGKDILFLCETRKDDSKVIGIDLQSQAIAGTRKLLKAHGFSPKLYEMDHSDMEKIIAGFEGTPVSAAIFNLGYLPGGDHRITTQPGSTLGAIRSLLARASKTLFRLAIVAYRGHPGGREEAQAVARLLWESTPNGFAFSQISCRESENTPLLFRLERPVPVDRALEGKASQ